MAKRRDKRKARLRKTKAELVDELEALERRLGDEARAQTQRNEAIKQTASREDERARELTADQTLLQAVIDNSPTEIILKDTDRKYVLVNKTFQDRYGVTLDQVVGKTVEECFPPYEAKQAHAHDDKVFAQRESSETHIEIEVEGELRVVEEVKFPLIDPTGNILGVGAVATDVTERARMERVLRESEKQRRALTDNTPMALIHLSTDERYIFVNRTYERWLMRPAGEIVGRTVTELLGTEAATRLRPHFQKGFSGEQDRFEETVTYPDGVTRHIQSYVTPDKNEVGDTTAIFLGVTDISNLVEAHQAREKSETHRRHVLDSISTAIMYLDGDGRYRFINKRCAEWYGCNADDVVGKTLTDVLGSATAEVVLDRIAGLAAAGESTFERPFKFPGGVTRFTRATYTPEFDTEGNHVGTFIAVEDITDQKQAEARLLDAIESTSDGFIYFDADERFVMCNDRYREFFPLIEDQFFVGNKLADLSRISAERGQHMDQNIGVDEWVADRLKIYREGREVYEQQTADGRWILSTVNRTRDGGSVGVHTDITERKRAEEAARDRENQLRAATDNMPMMLLHCDPDGRYRYVNRVAEQWYAQPASEIVGKRIYDVLEPVMTPLIEDRSRRAMAGELVTFEDTVNYPDGVTRTVQGTYAADLDSNGHARGFFIVLMDVSNQKRAEMARFEAESRFRAIVDNSMAGITLKGVDGRFLMVNETFASWSDSEPSAMIGKTTYDISPADEADEVTRHDQLVIETGDNFSAEVSRACKDGKVRTILSHKFPVHDASGEPYAVATILTDISERVATERARVEAESRFRAIVDNSLAGIVLKGLDGRLLLVNDTYAEWCSSTPEELVGRTTNEIYSSVEAAEIDRHDRAVFDTGERLVTEVLRNFRDGRTRTLVSHKFPIRDGDGQITAVATILTDISERVMAEQARIDSDRQASAVMDSPNAAIVIKDKDMRIIRANKTYNLWMTGNPEPLVGRQIADFMPVELVPNISERDRQVLSFGEDDIVELTRQFEDGITRTVIDHKSPIFSDDGEVVAVCTILTDISERVAAERARIESEQQVNAIIESSLAGIVLKDTELRILRANRTYCEWAGIEPEQLIGKSAHAAYPKDIADDIESRDRLVLQTGQENAAETSRRLTDGRTRTVLSHKSPIFSDAGEVIAVCTVITDVTDLRQAESQMVHSEKLATLGRMAAGITHELAQPLNNIRLATQSTLINVEDGVAEMDEAAKTLQLIDGQITRMSEIIDHMRIFARKEAAGGDKFKPTKSVTNAIGFMNQQFTAAGVALNADIPDVTGQVVGSEVQLEQVLLNLLTNAGDAIRARIAESEPGEFQGRITLSMREVPEVGVITVIVEDNGGGIPADELAYVFEPFYTTKEVGMGTGLGLSVSYTIIQSMNGDIAATNGEHGAKFTISLPLADGPGDAAKPAVAGEVRANAPARLNGGTILISEDETTASDYLARHLEKSGYRVLSAANGVEALKIFNETDIIALITDLQMPEMDGTELIGRIRESRSDIPIFVMTGKLAIGEKNPVVAPGATKIFKKPIDLKEMMTELSSKV